MSANLRVAIDVTSIQFGRGVSRYTSNLVRALSTIDQLELQAFGFSIRGRDALQQELKQSGVSGKIFPIPIRVMHEVWNSMQVLPASWLVDKPQVLHTWEVQPPDKDLPIVNTIHDLAMWRYPQTAHPLVFEMQSKGYHILTRNPRARFIAVSHQTKKDFLEYFPIEESRITVVHSAQPIEQQIQVSAEKRREILRRLEIKKPYLLFVGTTEPRKNLPRMIEAWRKYKKEYEFIVVGAKGWDSIKQESGLRCLGYVEGDELAAIQSGATVMMYASLYEGFGFPILDAFYHGVPVVTSNNSAMVEVAGSAGILVDPEDENSIELGIESAIKQRSSLIRKGKKRLKHFDWNQTAAGTAEVYRKATQE